MSRFGHFYTVSYTICPFSETSLISLLKTALDIKELDYEHLIRILMLQVLYWQWLLLQQAMLGMAHHSDLLDVFWVVSTKLNMQILCCAPTLLPYSLQKCLEWLILIISVSATCNIAISWFDFSDLWTAILWYCLFCYVLLVLDHFDYYLQFVPTRNSVIHHFLLSYWESPSFWSQDLHHWWLQFFQKDKTFF